MKNYYFLAIGIFLAITPSFSQYIPDANTVALYHFDETSGTTVLDASGNGINGTATGTSIVDGKFGKARSYNGNSGKVLTNSSSSFNFNGPLTLEAWVKINSVQATGTRIICMRAFAVDLYLANGKIGTCIDNSPSTGACMTSNFSLIPGIWYHTAVTWDGTMNDSSIKLYVNGEIVISFASTISTIALTNNPIALGGHATSSSSAYVLDGIVDEVRYSNKARQPWEFEYQVDANTAALYHFSETIPGTVIDESTNGNNGAATGTTIVDGKFGKARSFNGMSDKIDVNDSPSLDLADAFTAEAWIKLSSLPTGDQAYTILDKGQSGIRNYMISIRQATFPGPSDGFSVASRNASGEINLNPDYPLEINKYYHLALVGDGSTLKFYVNGVLIDQVNATSPYSTNGDHLGIGYRPIQNDAYFHGIIDEVRISNIAREQWEFGQGAVVSGKIFNDVNADGVWDANEPALSGWTVKLKQNSVEIASDITDQDGAYSFTGLDSGVYTVEEEVQTDWIQTYPTFPGTWTVTLGTGEVVTGKDFGNKNSYVHLTSPTGGENWNVGTPHLITWEKSSDISTIDLYLSTDNGTSWNPIVTSFTPVVNSYPWLVNGSPSSQCLIKITDAANASVMDVSDNPFIIGQGARIRIDISNVPNGQVAKIRLTITSFEAPFEITKDWDGTSMIVFENDDLQILNHDGESSYSIDLLRNDNSLYGHMPFHYTHEDLDLGRQIDLYLTVHNYGTGWEPNSGWNYYKDADEKMLSMLIPPFRSFDLINYNKPPLLLVHGVNGTYPYWDKGDLTNHNFVDELCQDYDAWQFYYPYDQYIEKSALLIRDAVDRILGNPGPNGAGTYPPGAKMNIVAHSMGGLITRSYIQSNEYEGNIRKLLMLGTPNHGSYLSYRIAYTHFADELCNISDDHAPAWKQMSPGSDFLRILNDIIPKDLSNVGQKSKDYLVVAGTKDIADNWLLTHEEIDKQDDGVVSVSSASLLNYEIPLATMMLGHTRRINLSCKEYGYEGLNSDISKVVVYRFLSDEYDPESINEPLMQMVDGGFWRGFGDNPKPDNSQDFEPGRGIITMKIPGINKKIESLQILKDNYTLKIREYGPIAGLLLQEDFLIRIEDTDNFFSLDNDLINMIGLSYDEGSYNVHFKTKKDKTYLWLNEALPFHHLGTTMALINLRRGQLTIINSESEVPPSTSPIATSSQSFYLLKRQAKVASAVQQSMEYTIDAMIDSVTFLLAGDDDESSFPNHDMHLQDPDGIIIDSTYAKNDTTMEFYQDLLHKFAYFFISNPKPGTWKVLYDTSLHYSEVVAPIASQVNLSLTLSDSMIARGDSVSFTVIVNSPSQPAGINIVCRIYQSIGNGDTLLLISTVPVSSSPDSNSFTGKFFADQSGEFLVGVEYSASIFGEPMFRNSLSSLFVNELVAPNLIYPANGQQNIGHDVRLKWHSANNAASYALILFALGNSVPFVEQNNITDTTFDVVGLLDSVSYYWQVRSMSSSDTSNWSELRNFKTIGSVCIKISKGWNLISIPVRKSPFPKEEIFSPTASNAFRYLPDMGYQDSDSLVHSIGYWLKFSDTASFCMLALPLASDSITVSSGWNLIGSISIPLATSSITSTPPGIVTSEFYSYRGGYFVSPTIEPGKGYWMKASQSGVLILSSSNIEPSNRIRIVPTSELPPPPPDGQISNPKSQIPNRFSLDQNFPNPFNPSTSIKFGLPSKSNVKLEVYNTLGQRVSSLVNEQREAGYYVETLNSTSLPSGVYFYRLEAVDANNPVNRFTEVRKMVLIK